jgi:hypothetical protein
VSVARTGTVVLFAEILPGRARAVTVPARRSPSATGLDVKAMENVGPCRRSVAGTAPQGVDRGPWTAEPWTVDRADGAIDAAHMTNPPAGEEVVVTGTNLTVTNPNPKVS